MRDAGLLLPLLPLSCGRPQQPPHGQSVIKRASRLTRTIATHFLFFLYNTEKCFLLQNIFFCPFFFTIAERWLPFLLGMISYIMMLSSWMLFTFKRLRKKKNLIKREGVSGTKGKTLPSRSSCRIFWTLKADSCRYSSTAHHVILAQKVIDVNIMKKRWSKKSGAPWPAKGKNEERFS